MVTYKNGTIFMTFGELEDKYKAWKKYTKDRNDPCSWRIKNISNKHKPELKSNEIDIEGNLIKSFEKKYGNMSEIILLGKEGGIRRIKLK